MSLNVSTQCNCLIILRDYLYKLPSQKAVSLSLCLYDGVQNR